MMNSKFYIAIKEDKVGTAFAVAKYEEDEFRQVLINKVNSNGLQAYEDIVRWLIDNDTKSSMMSFKFRNVDIAVHIGNMLDKTDEYKKISKEKHCIFFSSPSTFTNDFHKMHKAEASLGSYLILREHYIKTGKIK